MHAHMSLFMGFLLNTNLALSLVYSMLSEALSNEGMSYGPSMGNVKVFTVGFIRVVKGLGFGVRQTGLNSDYVISLWANFF